MPALWPISARASANGRRRRASHAWFCFLFLFTPATATNQQRRVAKKLRALRSRQIKRCSRRSLSSYKRRFLFLSPLFFPSRVPTVYCSCFTRVCLHPLSPLSLKPAVCIALSLKAIYPVQSTSVALLLPYFLTPYTSSISV